MATNGALSITITSGTDAGSGLARSVLSRAEAPVGYDGTCGTFTSFEPIASDPTDTFADTTLAAATCYRYKYTETDNVENSTTASPATIVQTPGKPVDPTPPTAKLDSLTPITGAAYQHAAGSLLYYNPNEAGSVQITVDAADPESGIASIAFPSIGTGWSAGGNVSGGPSPFTHTYAWVAGASAQESLTAVATDTAGLTTSIPFSFTPDAEPPAKGTISYQGGPVRTLGQPITFAPGTDELSGLAPASIVVERREAPLVSSLCGTWGTYEPVTGPVAVSPVIDTHPASDGCYEYALAYSDNVANQRIVVGARDIELDATAPSTTITAAAGSQPDSVSIAGTTADGGTGVATVAVTWTASNGASGSVCAPQPADAFACTWDTTGVATGTYSVTATVTDRAGNVATSTAMVFVDTTPPRVAFASYEPVTGIAYQHTTGASLYVNPAHSGAVTVIVDASDDAGPVSVTFPHANAAGWVDAAAVASSPAYAHTYTWDVGAAAPRELTAIATDAAGNSQTVRFTIQTDTSAPAGGSITYANGATSARSQTIAFAVGSDIGSGIAPESAAIQRATAALTAGTCGEWSAWTTVSPNGLGTSPFTDALPPQAACYRWRLIDTDSVANEQIVTSANVVKFNGDTTPPVASLIGFTSEAGAAYLHATGSTAFVNGSHAGSITVAITATDNVQVAQVNFQSVATLGWTDIAVPASPPEYMHTYSWSDGASSPGQLAATITDNAGNATSVPFTIKSDDAAPTGGTISYPSRVTNTASETISFAPGNDPDSGLDPTSVAIQRAEATLVNGVCGTYGAWSAVAPTGLTSPYTDTTLSQVGCYKWRLVDTDNVANEQIVTSTNEVKVDNAPPTNLTAYASGSSPVSITGTATDAETGVARISATFTGSDGHTGSVCDVAPVGTTWTCTWDTTGLPMDQYYELHITATDEVGNSANTDISVPVFTPYEDGGALDTAFGDGGITTTDFGPGDARALAAVQEDNGDIVEAGSYQTSGVQQIAIARLTENGTPDTAFATDGKLLINTLPNVDVEHATGAIAQPGGKTVIIATGVNNSSKMAYFIALRITATGALDPTFGTNGITEIPIGPYYTSYTSQAAEQADGKIVTAARLQGGSEYEMGAIRIDENGAPDPTFGTGGIVVVPTAPDGLSGVTSLAIQANGEILLAGNDYTAAPYKNGKEELCAVRLEANGSIDTGFATDGLFVYHMTDGDDTVEAVSTDSQGRILLGGTNHTLVDNGPSVTIHSVLVRVTPTGSLDTTFGDGGAARTAFPAASGNAWIDLLTMPNDNVITTGYAPDAQSGHAPQFTIAKYTALGELDPAYGESGITQTPIATNSQATRVLAARNGDIVAVGYADFGSGHYEFATAAYG